MSDNKKHTIHRFLDEAGDTTFFGKGKVNIVGRNGVSNCFILGMVKFKTDLNKLRGEIRSLQRRVEDESYFKEIHSISKKKNKGGFYFHATDDIPEVRKIFFDFIRNIDCSFEAVAGRKIISVYEKKHNLKGNEFYADLLSHLLKDKFYANEKLVLNVAHRKNSTENQNLKFALSKATARFKKDNPRQTIQTEIVFNEQNQSIEPLLNVADYFCWSVQRVFEMGETRFYNYLQDKISWVIDLYDTVKYAGNKHYYTIKNPLTDKNKLSPPLP